MKVILDGKKKNIKAVEYREGKIILIDQRKLPHKLEFFMAENYEDVAFAIKEMVVRGAPAIGITAAFGLAQATLQGQKIETVYKKLKNTRPTAYDLFHALDTIKIAIENGKDPEKEAQQYAKDIENKCKKIGENGETIIKDGYKILTHCNAGALAVSDWGTALAPIRIAQQNGKKIFVFVDETRPRLQGTSLTAWELQNEGIKHAIIADNAAGYFMLKKEIDMVIVGADRITKNGDVANKIGTYEKAVLAHENGIPFYVAAPFSTFDFTLESGMEIPIEERDEKEVLYIENKLVCNPGSGAGNPAFDVTPARFIEGIITEKGIVKPDELSKLR